MPLAPKTTTPIDYSKIAFGPVTVPTTVAPTAKAPAATTVPVSPIGPSPVATAAIAGINTDKPIDVGALTAPSTLALPSLPTPPIPNTANALPDLSAYYANTPEQDQLNADETNLETGITADTTQLGTKAARQSALETQAGLPDLNKQLKEINDQILQTQNEARTASNTSEDRKAPTFVIQGEQAQIERQRAAKQFGLAAASQAIQGNISLANDAVTRALDAEFGGIQADIDNKKYLLGLNRDNFSDAEKKQADIITAELNKQQADLTQQRADKASILQIMTKAAQNGADNVTLQKIQAATSPEDALAIAGSTLKDKPSTQVVEANGRQLLIDSSTGKTISDLGASASALSGGAGALPTTVQTAQDLTSVLGNSKISATTKTNVGNLLGVISSAESLAKSNPGGVFQGISPFNAILDAKIPFTNIGIPGRDAFRSDAGVKNTGALDAINLRVQQWASGASLTKQQIDQVNKMVPTANDTDRVVKAKLNNLVNTMNQYISGNLAAEGITYSPAPVDLFASQQSLADIFNQ